MSNPDPEFLRRTLAAIDELHRLVLDRPHGNDRHDQLVTDLHAAFVRYLRGARCSQCRKRTQFSEIATEVFCSDVCRTIKEALRAEQEQSLKEALAQYE